jgi:hypothetical protein
LVKDRATYNGEVGTGLLQSGFSILRPCFASTGKEHEPFGPEGHGEIGKDTDVLGHAGKGQIRIDRNIDRTRAFDGAVSGRPIVPIEGDFGGAGRLTIGQVGFAQPLNETATGLTVCANDENGLIGRSGMCLEVVSHNVSSISPAA